MIHFLAFFSFWRPTNFFGSWHLLESLELLASLTIAPSSFGVRYLSVSVPQCIKNIKQKSQLNGVGRQGELWWPVDTVEGKGKMRMPPTSWQGLSQWKVVGSCLLQPSQLPFSIYIVLNSFQQCLTVFREQVFHLIG